jgi:hypothetical protein
MIIGVDVWVVIIGFVPKKVLGFVVERYEFVREQ